MSMLAIPFGRGETFYAGRTIDASSLQGDDFLGITRTFNDINATTRTKNTGLYCVAVLLRNLSGGTLFAKEAIQFSGTVPAQATSGKTSAANQLFAVVDEYLPAIGVPANDIFWAVVKGPTTAKFVTVSGAKSAGQLLVGSSSTAGKLDFISTSPGSATIAQNAAVYGRAFTEGAIANAAEEARVYLTSPFFGC